MIILGSFGKRVVDFLLVLIANHSSQKTRLNDLSYGIKI